MLTLEEATSKEKRGIILVTGTDFCLLRKFDKFGQIRFDELEGNAQPIYFHGFLNEPHAFLSKI